MTDVDVDVDLTASGAAAAPLSFARAAPWALALLGGALYPSVLTLFPPAVQRASGADSPGLQALWGGGALLVMALAIGVPLFAFWALLRTPAAATPRAIAVRRLLHVIIAVPPLYTFTRLVAGRVGLVEWHGGLWLAAAAGAALLLANMRGSALKTPPAPLPAALRKVHAATAAILFVGFLFIHVLNHGAALWSVELQAAWMSTFRLWYRAAWVEPVLLGSLGVMVLTGIPLMLHNTRSGGSAWRSLQSVAGFYIFVFLCSHVTAVLTARADGRETDWVFATGQNGLIAGSSSLIPYYLLSIAMLMIHSALAVRMGLLKRGVEAARVSRVFSALLWLAGLCTLWVTAAMLGVELRG